MLGNSTKNFSKSSDTIIVMSKIHIYFAGHVPPDSTVQCWWCAPWNGRTLSTPPSTGWRYPPCLQKDARLRYGHPNCNWVLAVNPQGKSSHSETWDPSSGLFGRRVSTSIIARWDGFVTSYVIPTLGRLEALRNSSGEGKIIEYHIDHFVPVIALKRRLWAHSCVPRARCFSVTDGSGKSSWTRSRSFLV